METQEASGKPPFTAKNDSPKTVRIKKTCELDYSKPLRKKWSIVSDPAF